MRIHRLCWTCADRFMAGPGVSAGCHAFTLSGDFSKFLLRVQITSDFWVKGSWLEMYFGYTPNLDERIRHGGCTEIMAKTTACYFAWAQLWVQWRGGVTNTFVEFMWKTSAIFQKEHASRVIAVASYFWKHYPKQTCKCQVKRWDPFQASILCRDGSWPIALWI